MTVQSIAMPGFPIDQALSHLLNKIKAALSSLEEHIQSNISNAIGNLGDKITGIGETVTAKLDSAVTFIGQSIDTYTNNIKDSIGKALGSIAKLIATIPASISALVSKITELAESLTHKVIDRIGKALDKTVASFESAINSLLSAFRSEIDVLKDKLSNLVKALKAKLAEIGKAIAELASKIYHAVTSSVSAVVDEFRNFASKIIDKVIEFGKRVAEQIKRAWQAGEQVVRGVISKLLEKLRKAVEAIHDKIVELTDKASAWINEHIVKPLRDEFQQAKDVISFKADVLRRAALGEYGSWDALVADITDPPGVVGILAGLFIALIAAPAIGTGVGLVVSVALENIMNLLRQKFRPTQIPPELGISAVLRGVMGYGEFQQSMALSGYKDSYINAMVEGQRPLPSPAQIREAYVRGNIDDPTHDALLSKHGYDPASIALIKALYQLIPGPSDLIRMAVREAFSPEIAEKFGQYEDFPEEFAKWAEKQGLSRDWAERYWAAHWALPSVQQGFEMYHRGVISDEELALLLRAQDVMPFWRDKLVAIAYQPYTRVDVRRMYKIGVLDEEDVYRAYRDLGYDHEKATNLTLFTTRYYEPEDTEQEEFRKLTRSVIMSAYKRKVIDRNEAIDQLRAIGYADTDAEFLVNLADAEYHVSHEDRIPLKQRTTNMVLDAYKRGLYGVDDVKDSLAALGYTEEEIDWYVTLSDYEVRTDYEELILESIHKKYVQRTISKMDAQIELGKLNLSRGEIHYLFSRWDIERESRTRKPTEAQFRAMLYQGIISIDEYKEELAGLGYPDTYVEKLAKLAEAKWR